jgi:molybdopterin/thiamine biosynthesis adenylyltransferase
MKDTSALDRYGRQKMIPGWNQQALTQSFVLVLGAGALGNEIVKNLALIGVGTILIVDFDLVEATNLSRTVLFSQEDIGMSKAEVLARNTQKLNPDIAVYFIHGNILHDIGLGYFRNADLIIGGLDNIAARAHASTYSALAGKPYLDAGLWEFGGEVRWFFSGQTACFECTLSLRDRDSIRYSCTGFQSDHSSPAIPTTLAPAAVIGGMTAQEAYFYLTGSREIKPGEALVYNGYHIELRRSKLPLNPTCPNHVTSAYTPVELLAHSPHTITAKDLFELAEPQLGEASTLILGRDVLIYLHCPVCQEKEIYMKLINKIPESNAICQICGGHREVKIISTLERRDSLIEFRLDELGIPKGEVIAMVSANGVMAYFELHLDVEQLMPAEA